MHDARLADQTALNLDYHLDKEEMAGWAQRIRDCGASQVWAYFNNDHDGYAIKNAHDLLKCLKQLRSH